jgi:hypothetical protein
MTSAFAAACGGGTGAPPSDAPLPTLASIGGPENILVRIPRAGGLVRGYRWPAIDSPIWTANEKVPAITGIIAFDDANGQLVFSAEGKRTGRVDFRTGKVQVSEDSLTGAASADGVSLYGINTEGRVTRSTTSAVWRGPRTRGDTVLALPAGHVAMVAPTDDETLLIRFHPPSVTPMDTLEVPRIESIVRSPTGDRLYAQTARGIVTIDARAWSTAPGPRTSDPPLSITVTPSGDRVLLLDADGRRVRIWNRFTERFDDPVLLPSPASELRIDPLGRYALARTELVDSVIVISVPLRRVVRALASEWRGDLPTVAPNGTVLTLRGGDVWAVDPVSGTRRTRSRGGASDFWTVVRWDGFRPRDRSLDAPVTFDIAAEDSLASTAVVDSLLAEHAALVAAERLDSIVRANQGEQRRADTSARVYTLQFASLLSEAAARGLAERIRVDGRPPRVVAGTTDGVTIYRVVLGPYASREAAEAAGRRSGVPFWVFAGLP